MAVQANKACVSLLCYHRKSSPVLVPGTQCSRNCMNTRISSQAKHPQPEVTSVCTVTPLKAFCYCGERHYMIFVIVTLIQWFPACVPGAADGGGCMNVVSRCQALRSWPEVTDVCRVFLLRSSSYSGEDCCLLAVAAPLNQTLTLCDTFCFLLKKNNVAPIDSRPEEEPDIQRPEANAKAGVSLLF